jgi:hypothetical protein
MERFEWSPGAMQRVALWGGAAALMLLAILPERLTGTIAWDAGEFVFLALLLGAVGAHELAARVPRRFAYRAAVALGVAAGLLQAWINLAVGTIGSEDNPANAIYFAVVTAASLGAVLVRLRARGMAWVMLAAAVAQVLAFLIALVAGLGFTGPITVFFVALWLASARLFRTAS